MTLRRTAGLADWAVIALGAETAGWAFPLAAADAAGGMACAGLLTEAACRGPAGSMLPGAAAAAAPLTGMGAKTPTAAVALAAG
jgi:hypothetical protein